MVSTMKKQIIKKLIVFPLAFIMAFISMVIVNAESIFESYGYSYTIINNFKISLCGWDNRTTNLEVPDIINDRQVVDISNEGLKGNTQITSVDFSKASYLERIGMFAFQNCTGISNELKIPASVTRMSTGAFEGCSSIPSVVFNANMTEVPAQTFNKCTSLSSVTLPDYIESIGNYAFANCTSLTYIKLGRNVTSIANSAFQNDTNITLGVWYNSYAHQYAKDKNIPYKLLDGVKLGDVNMDGVVNINDVTAIQRDIAMLDSFNELQKIAEDVNRDGVVNISDATTLQMYLAHKRVPYPINETITQ